MKYIFSFLFSLIISFSFGQTETEIIETQKETAYYIDAAISFRHSYEKIRSNFFFEGEEFNTRTINHFSFSSNFGKTFSKHWGMGLGFSLSKKSFQNSNRFQQVTETLTIGLGFFTRYKLFLNQKLNFFFQPAYNFTVTRNKKGEGGMSTQLSITPGCTYQIARRFRILANLGSISYYFSDNSSSSFFEIKTTSSNFNSSFNLSSISIGAEFTF